MKLQFSQRFSKETAITNFMDIRPMGEDFFRRTDVRREGWTEKHCEFKNYFFFFAKELATEEYSYCQRLELAYCEFVA